MELLLGADPEAFVVLKDGSVPVSAAGLLPGTKEKPFPVKDGAVQVDGMAAEFNIDPAATEDAWVHNLKSVMGQLEGMLPDTHRLEIVPSITFSPEVWEAAPDVAKIMGCDPDLNAYTGRENKPPNADTDFRTAAGHIHFGWCEGVNLKNKGHVSACRILARELDYYLGRTSCLGDFSEAGVKRRQLYGSAGAFRVKSYGMEYRVLSNYWLQSEELMRWVYKVCHFVFNRLLDGNYTNQPKGEPPSHIVAPLYERWYLRPDQATDMTYEMCDRRGNRILIPTLGEYNAAYKEAEEAGDTPKKNNRLFDSKISASMMWLEEEIEEGGIPFYEDGEEVEDEEDYF